MSSIPDHLYQPALSARHPRKIAIEEESSWRRNTRAASNIDCSLFEMGRWKKWHTGTHELLAPVLNNHYTIEVLLGDAHVDCFKNELCVISKRAGFGATQIAAPGQSIRCRFDRSISAIHLFITRSAVVAACEDLQQRSCPIDFEINDPCFATDPAMGRLVEALADTGTLDDSLFMCYVESLLVAVLARLIGTRSNVMVDKSFHTGLLPWRLRRATDFIEENLGEAITLSDIAIHAGLSRMHFAAQFRRTTGLTPHNFLTARRIERAKNMLSDSRLEIVEIEAAVGFNSQQYFTTVFHRVTGTTPRCWRNAIR